MLFLGRVSGIAMRLVGLGSFVSKCICFCGKADSVNWWKEAYLRDVRFYIDHTIKKIASEDLKLSSICFCVTPTINTKKTYRIRSCSISDAESHSETICGDKKKSRAQRAEREKKRQEKWFWTFNGSFPPSSLMLNATWTELREDFSINRMSTGPCHRVQSQWELFLFRRPNEPISSPEWTNFPVNANASYKRVGRDGVKRGHGFMDPGTTYLGPDGRPTFHSKLSWIIKSRFSQV